MVPSTPPPPLGTGCEPPSPSPQTPAVPLLASPTGELYNSVAKTPEHPPPDDSTAGGSLKPSLLQHPLDFLFEPSDRPTNASLESLHANISFSYGNHGESTFDQEYLFPFPNWEAPLPLLRFDPSPPHHLTAATITALVAQLTSPNSVDYDFLYDFFLTYRMFVTAPKLLELLMSRFVWALQYHAYGHSNAFESSPPPPKTSPKQTGRSSTSQTPPSAGADGSDTTENLSQNYETLGALVLVRTFVSLRHWIMNFFPQDFAGNYPLQLQFVNSLNEVIECLGLVSSHLARSVILDLRAHWLRVSEEINAASANVPPTNGHTPRLLQPPRNASSSEPNQALFGYVPTLAPSTQPVEKNLLSRIMQLQYQKSTSNLLNRDSLEGFVMESHHGSVNKRVTLTNGQGTARDRSSGYSDLPLPPSPARSATSASTNPGAPPAPSEASRLGSAPLSTVLAGGSLLGVSSLSPVPSRASSLTIPMLGEGIVLSSPLAEPPVTTVSSGFTTNGALSIMSMDALRYTSDQRVPNTPAKKMSLPRRRGSESGGGVFPGFQSPAPPINTSNLSPRRVLSVFRSPRPPGELTFGKRSPQPPKLERWSPFTSSTPSENGWVDSLGTPPTLPRYSPDPTEGRTKGSFTSLRESPASGLRRFPSLRTKSSPKTPKRDSMGLRVDPEPETTDKVDVLAEMAVMELHQIALVVQENLASFPTAETATEEPEVSFEESVASQLFRRSQARLMNLFPEDPNDTVTSEDHESLKLHVPRVRPLEVTRDNTLGSDSGDIPVRDSEVTPGNFSGDPSMIDGERTPTIEGYEEEVGIEGTERDRHWKSQDSQLASPLAAEGALQDDSESDSDPNEYSDMGSIRPYRAGRNYSAEDNRDLFNRQTVVLRSRPILSRISSLQRNSVLSDTKSYVSYDSALSADNHHAMVHSDAQPSPRLQDEDNPSESFVFEARPVSVAYRVVLSLVATPTPALPLRVVVQSPGVAAPSTASTAGTLTASLESFTGVRGMRVNSLRASAKSYISYDSNLSVDVADANFVNMMHPTDILRKKHNFGNLRLNTGGALEEVFGGPLLAVEQRGIPSTTSVLGEGAELRASASSFDSIFEDLRDKALGSGLSTADSAEAMGKLNRAGLGVHAKMRSPLPLTERAHADSLAVLDLEPLPLREASPLGRESTPSVLIPGLDSKMLMELANIPDDDVGDQDALNNALMMLEGRFTPAKHDSHATGFPSNSSTLMDVHKITQTHPLRLENERDPVTERESFEVIDTGAREANSVRVRSARARSVRVSSVRASSVRASSVRTSPVEGDLSASAGAKGLVLPKANKITHRLSKMLGPGLFEGEGATSQGAKDVQQVARYVSERYDQIVSLAIELSLPLKRLMETDAHCPFIMHHSSFEVAVHLTYVERDLLLDMDWEELIGLKWNQNMKPYGSWLELILDHTDIRGVELVISRFNLMVNWVISQVVLCREPALRRSIVSRFIHIAQHCKDLQNYNSLVQILLALTNAQINGLKETWRLLDPGDILMFKNLETLTLPTKNFQRLRRLMDNVKPSKGCIPFLGLYMSDLTFNAERSVFIRPQRVTLAAPLGHDQPTEMPDTLETTINTTNEIGAKLINFGRFRTSVSIVKSLSKCLEWSKLYALTVEPGLLRKCLYVRSLTDDQMFRVRKFLVEP